jgi:hypothetical protein
VREKREAREREERRERERYRASEREQAREARERAREREARESLSLLHLTFFLSLSSTTAKRGPASSNYCTYLLHLITLLLAFTSPLQCNSNKHPNYFLSSTSGHPRSQCLYI